MPKIKSHSIFEQTPYRFLNGNDSPLHMAVRLGKCNLIAGLFEHGQDMDHLNGEGDTPLHLAILNNKPNVVKTLLNFGAKISNFDEKKRNPIYTAIMLDRQNIIEVIMECVGYISIRNDSGRTPLHVAVIHNRINILEILLKFDAEVNGIDLYGNTPLHMAVTHGNLSMTKLLLENGANPHYFNGRGSTPMHLAVSEDKENVLKMLIQFKASVNQPNRAMHYSPLHIAAICDKCDIIKTLILSGADIDIMEINGNTPLHLAVDHNNFKAAETLIHLGACVDPKNIAFKMPLHKAVIENNLKLVEMLIPGTKTMDYNDYRGYSPLDYALLYCNPKMLEILFQAGASINQEIWNERNETPRLYIASRYYEKNFIEKFRKLKFASKETKATEGISTDSSLTEKDERFNELLKNDISLSDLLESAKIFIKYEILYFGEKSKMYEKWLSQQSEIYPPLISYVEDCFKEVICMNSKIIHEGITFLKLVTKARNTVDLLQQPSLAQDYINHILNIQYTNAYPIYRDVIALRVQKLFLRTELLKYALSTSISRRKQIFVDYGSLSVISDYLSNIDILNLTLAISN